MIPDKLVLLEFAKAAIVSFVALFPVVNPLGSAPFFHAITRQCPRDMQTALARKVALYGLLLLAGSLFLGVRILAFFGISLNVVQVAGGVVIASTGWKLLCAESQDQDAGEVTELANRSPLTRAFYPLTLPLTVGPGAISTAIGLGAHLHGNAIEMTVAATLGMAALSAIVWVVYHNANRMETLLGSTGTEILNRLSSFVLFALGLQILWNGMAVALKSLMK